MQRAASFVFLTILLAAAGDSAGAAATGQARPAPTLAVRKTVFRKTCLSCSHVVSSLSKIGDRCPYCGVVWKSAAVNAAQSGAPRGRAAGPAVQATTASMPFAPSIPCAPGKASGVAVASRPISAVISDRLRDLDDAVDRQSADDLRGLLALNFVLLGKDGKVELDYDRYVESTITEAIARSVSRKSTLQGVKSVDGELVATVRVASKRYLPDTKPEYVVTYEQQTWTVRSGVPRLRVIKLVRRKGR